MSEKRHPRDIDNAIAFMPVRAIGQSRFSLANARAFGGLKPPCGEFGKMHQHRMTFRGGGEIGEHRRQ